MNVVAEVTVPVDAFVLGRVLRAHPAVRIRLERVVPTGAGPIPYVWVPDAHIDAVEGTLREMDAVDAIARLDSVDGETLVRIEWAQLPTDFLAALADSGARVYETVGEDETWRFSLRFPDHEAMTTFYRQCLDKGIEITVRTVDSSNADGASGVGLDITDAQRETLRVALAAGYFDVPRQVNLTELADQLDISDTATSERLRRGISALLIRTLTVDDPDRK